MARFRTARKILMSISRTLWRGFRRSGFLRPLVALHRISILDANQQGATGFPYRCTGRRFEVDQIKLLIPAFNGSRERISGRHATPA